MKLSSEFIKKLNDYMFKADYKKAYDEIEKTQADRSYSEEELLILDYKRCLILRYLGEFEKVIQISKTTQAKAINQANDLVQIDSLILEIFSHYRLNRIELVQNLLDKAECLLSKIKDKEIPIRRTKLLTYRVYACIAEGEFERAQILAQENFTLSREQNNPELIASAYYVNGWVSMHKGELSDAIYNYHESLTIREKLNNHPYDLAHSLFGLGYGYKNIGDLDKAYSCLSRCKEIREKIGNQQDIAWTLLNLGDVFYQKNEVKKAQEFYDHSLIINRMMNYTFGIIFSLRRLSSVYESMKEPQLVIDTLEKALEFAKQLEDVDPEVYTLFDLIKYDIENKLDSNKLKSYLSSLKNINQRYNNRIFDQIYRLAQALIFNSEADKRSQLKARNLFREITEEEIMNFDYTRIAMQRYSKLLAEELNRYLSDESLSSQLTDLSESINPVVLYRSYSMVAENFLDLSQIALEEIDIDKARELLKRAQYLCDFLNLYNKGSTPFRIIYSLFVKERNLNELSKFLKITKGALSSQLKLLIDLDIVKISREEQIRSATMLKKYYSLGNKGFELLQPLNLELYNSLNLKETNSDHLVDTLMKPRLLTKIIRDATILTDNFQNFFEEQVLMKPSKPTDEGLSDKNLEDVKKIFSQSIDVQVEQFLLSEKQYQTYKKLWKEFSEKIKSEIIKENIDSAEYHATEKPIYVANLVLPISDLMELERYQLKKRKQNEKSNEE